ncbi:hypothetical protein [Mycolicibacterium sphagni]|nr:hypothetical protein [Mycolicibacterium sphagni]MCV7179540.1 hypothetical protein [Mycolicibacterium sphagni]
MSRDDYKRRQRERLNRRDQSPPREHEDPYLSSAGGGPDWSGDYDGDDDK